MSLNCFDFYRYTGKDIFSLLDTLQHVRKAHMAFLKETFRAYRTQGTALLALMKRATEQNDRSAFNLQVNAVLVPFEGNWYMKCFGLETDLLEGKPFVDCSYSGRSDRPDTITEEDWEERYRVIMNILREDYRFDRNGLTFVFSSEDDAYRLASL